MEVMERKGDADEENAIHTLTDFRRDGEQRGYLLGTLEGPAAEVITLGPRAAAGLINGIAASQPLCSESQEAIDLCNQVIQRANDCKDLARKAKLVQHAEDRILATLLQIACKVAPCQGSAQLVPPLEQGRRQLAWFDATPQTKAAGAVQLTPVSIAPPALVPLNPQHTSTP